MASFATARSVFRSSKVKNVASKLDAGVKPATSAARTSSIKPPSSSLTFRYRGVSSSVFVETMASFHTATASAVLTSLLSTSRCGAWLPEGNKFFRCSHSATNGTPRYMEFFASFNAAWLSVCDLYRGVSSMVLVETMAPFHTATASAILTSLLSTSRCGTWLPEGNKFFRCSHSATNGTPRCMEFFASSNAAWLEYTYPMPA